MITPEQYAKTPVYDLLREASEGRVGLDQRFLRAIVSRPEQAIPDLVKWGTEDHEDAPIDLTEELDEIFLVLNTPAAVPYFIHKLRLDPLNVSDIVVEALYNLRDHAMEPLLALHSELEEDQAGEVAFVLASFHKHDDRILKILLDRFEYDVGEGALCLGMYGDEAARPVLEKMLDEIGDSDEHLKTDLSDAISQLGRPVEEKPFGDDFNIWELYPEVAPPNFDMLSEGERLEMLSSDSPKFRAEAAASFVNRDLSDEARKRLFELAKSDPDVDVRGNAWEALAGEVDEHADIRNAMMQRLADASVDMAERTGALIGLASEARKPEVRSFAEEFYHIESTRAKAMECMWRSFDRSYAEYFPAHLDDEDEDVQRQAIWGIGYLGITTAAERLVPFFEDHDLRPDALFAYALSARHEISKARIRGLYRKLEELSGGLNERESELVQLALDERLMLHGLEPVFFKEEGEKAEPGPVVVNGAAAGGQPGRNDPCPCGSGKKYKKCHGSAE